MISGAGNASLSGLGAGLSKYGGSTGAPSAGLAGLGAGLSQYIPSASPGSPVTGFDQGNVPVPQPPVAPPVAPPVEPPVDDGWRPDIFGDETTGGPDALENPQDFRSFNNDSGIDWNHVGLIKWGEHPAAILTELEPYTPGSIHGGVNLQQYDWSNFNPDTITSREMKDHIFLSEVEKGTYSLDEQRPSWWYASLEDAAYANVYGHQALLDSGYGTEYSFSDGGAVNRHGSTYEEKLTQGAIQALDPASDVSEDDRMVILTEFENVFGEGAVEELIESLQNRQSPGGGEVEGPGTGTSDSIPAMINGIQPAALSDGEYVVNADDVKNTFGGGDKDRGVATIEALIGSARAQGPGGIMQGAA